MNFSVEESKENDLIKQKHLNADNLKPFKPFH